MLRDDVMRQRLGWKQCYGDANSIQMNDWINRYGMKPAGEEVEDVFFAIILEWTCFVAFQRTQYSRNFVKLG